jgi:hypothetical protein
MSEYERYGTLMVDECKVTPSKYFDKNRLEVMGFVNLRQYTPESQIDQLGDHILVLQYSGSWLFLVTWECCRLSLQAKLVLKATILCEASGLFIDVVTSDGAMWNRAMRKAFKAENSNKLGVYIRVTPHGNGKRLSASFKMPTK